MRFSPLREHRVKLAAAARASWSLCAVSGFLGDFLLRTCSTFFLFPSLSLAFSFFFFIIILNIHYLETAGAWKPISVLISKSLQHLGGYVQAITWTGHGKTAWQGWMPCGEGTVGRQGGKYGITPARWTFVPQDDWG